LKQSENTALEPAPVGAFRSAFAVDITRPAWLAKITNALNQHWQKRNAAKKNLLADGLANQYSSPVSVSMAAGG
jgi:hypothetical protein